MDDYLKEALEIVKAQASVRAMTEEELTSLMLHLARSIREAAAGGELAQDSLAQEVLLDSKKAIKEKTIICLECGKSFKILTRRHLGVHNLDAAAYREKWGYKKDTPLVCKALQRDRRKKMKDMKLWEKRRKA